MLNPGYGSAVATTGAARCHYQRAVAALTAHDGHGPGFAQGLFLALA
jgi:hypothetical protein